jgi:hypothetical protein
MTISAGSEVSLSVGLGVSVGCGVSTAGGEDAGEADALGSDDAGVGGSTAPIGRPAHPARTSVASMSSAP